MTKALDRLVRFINTQIAEDTAHVENKVYSNLQPSSIMYTTTYDTTGDGVIDVAALPSVSNTSSGILPATSGASTGDVASVKSDGTLEYTTPSGGIDSGTSFPGSPSTGDIFYRTDLRAICYYDGARWVGDMFVLPMSNWAAFSRDVTSTANVLSASMPDFSVFFEKLALAFNCGSVDASNYWTIVFYLHNGTSQVSLCSYTINSGSGWTRTTLTSFSPNPAPSSSIYILVQAAMTGSPGDLDVMSTLFVRRVFT